MSQIQIQNQLQKVGNQPKNLLKTVVGNDFNL